MYIFNWWWCCCWFCLRYSVSIVQVGSDFKTISPHFPKYWDSRSEPLYVLHRCILYILLMVKFIIIKFIYSIALICLKSTNLWILRALLGFFFFEGVIADGLLDFSRFEFSGFF